MSTVSPGTLNQEPEDFEASKSPEQEVTVKTETPAISEQDRKSVLDDINIDVDGMDLDDLDLESNALKPSEKDDPTHHSDVDIDFDPSFFSLENLEISKDKDGKTTIDGISFSILDNDEHELFEKDSTLLAGDLEELNGQDLFDDDNEKKDDKKTDLFDNDFEQDKLFKEEDLDQVDLFEEHLDQDLKPIKTEFTDDLNKQEELFRKVSESLSNDDLDAHKLDKSSLGDLFDFNLNAAIDSLNSQHLLSTPKSTRAQSEALETHIQKPKLQTYPASVPHSPTNSTAVLPNSTTFFLPRNFNSPLSQMASGSPTSKKPHQLSMLVKNRSDKSSTLQAINGATSENPEVHYIQSDEAPRVSAYARLDFPSFTFYVQTLQVILGRSAENGTGMVDVDLGPVKAISRRHAKIFYNFGTQRFELSVLGRNGAFVDDNFIDTGSTVPLKDGYVFLFH